MRIVTYNINGLRARLVPPRTLLSFLDSLESDIICLQETKTTRQELTADIAVTEGYESFFSCTRTVAKGRVGYSGVATFCRTGTAVPLAADEGFTGLLHVNRKGEIEGGKARVGCYEEVLNTDGMSRQELLELDREGRCLVTDHGSFVLFNIYGPSVGCDNEERYDFKLRFYRALQNRWEGLLKLGRRVIAVGDFNISPFPVDFCNPGLDFDQSSIRQWFRSQLRDSGGPFLDVFRVIHPNREEAYTCWNQKSGAEEFNFGSRIDLIIAAGTCFHQVQSEDNALKDDDNHHFGVCEFEDCDILQQFKRFKVDSLPRRGGEYSEKLEGSDHAPVYVQLRRQPPLDQHDVPPLAARFMPELRGRQQSIVSLLQKRPAGSQFTDTEACFTVREAKLKLSPPVATLMKKKGSKASKKVDSQKGKQKNLRSFFTSPTAKGKENTEDANIVKFVSQCSDSETLVKTSVVQTQEQVDSPQNEFSFLPESDVRSIGASASQVTQVSSTETLPLSESQSINEEPVDLSSISAINYNTNSEVQKSDFETTQQAAAKTEWQRIQRAMMNRVPLCSGHNEPCVARIVKKPGPNLGRTFHCCGRAEGPASNPEARCDYFEWQNKDKKKH
ncbi:hypothetical protein KC19_2G158000 [Ceratodon purpureus]|uniref:DNA-(apurinic or apyrimidinic site) endonuclease n=1 Tax=Ceratodon purpureus TaxID=3225 RepID=A0A8T0IY76_CERPU|nr:hypothetical protein KC19_2G158000 [Ceratodon purpureus]